MFEKYRCDAIRVINHETIILQINELHLNNKMKFNPILIFNSIQLFFFFGNFLFVASQADSKYDVGSRGIDSNQTTDDLYDIKGELGEVGNEYQNHDPEHDRTVVEPMDKALAVVYVVLTIVGLLANGIVFFVIFGRNEISKKLYKVVSFL